jgi:hypothetical protein
MAAAAGIALVGGLTYGLRNHPQQVASSGYQAMVPSSTAPVSPTSKPMTDGPAGEGL